MYFIKTNGGNCVVGSGAPDFSILNYDCHCQQLMLHLVSGRGHSICFNGSTSTAKNTFFQSPYSQICSLENKYYTKENAYILVA